MHSDNLRQKYSELVALTQLYILQEYPLDKRIPAEPASFEYFKQFALRQRQANQAAQTASQTVAVVARHSDVEPRTPTQPQVHVTRSLPAQPVAPVARHSDVEPRLPTQPPVPITTPPTIATPKHPDPIPERPLETPAATVPPAPPTPSPQTLKKPEKKTSNFFELQPLEPPAPSDFTDIRGIITPSLAVIDTVPNDSIAKQLLSGWKQQPQAQSVLVLSFNENEKQRNFLSNLTKAIQLCLAPAQIIPADKIERDKEWAQQLQSPDLRLILASDYGIYALPELMKHYKEDSKNAKRFLGKIPLLLLPDLSVYLKEPSLKPSLWRALCEILSPK